MEAGAGKQKCTAEYMYYNLTGPSCMVSRNENMQTQTCGIKREPRPYAITKRYLLVDETSPIRLTITKIVLERNMIATA